MTAIRRLCPSCGSGCRGVVASCGCCYSVVPAVVGSSLSCGCCYSVVPAVEGPCPLCGCGPSWTMNACNCGLPAFLRCRGDSFPEGRMRVSDSDLPRKKRPTRVRVGRFQGSGNPGGLWSYSSAGVSVFSGRMTTFTRFPSSRTLRAMACTSASVRLRSACS